MYINLLTLMFLFESGFDLGSCHYTKPRTGVLALCPHGHRKLSLLLMGNSIDGIRDVVSIANPTIPPMARSPVSISI